ncbi:uncharacterized protein LOC112058353 isoform X5 [Bicyclus anynana]|nr:uncharacterized protein LOC112058353 isoform X5 [Bicyclus anynana]
MQDPNIISIIIKFMETGIKDLNKYPLSKIIEISMAANFLQITELQQQIQEMLCFKLSESNCFEFMAVAEELCYTLLEQYSASYGLFSFKSMKPEHIPTIHKLIWYLSHPYLDSQNELHVFEFGLKWLFKNHKLDSILHIFACLDMSRVSNETLTDIKEFLGDYVNQLSDSLILEVIDCLLVLTGQELEISELSLCKHKVELCQKFSERVWSETLSVVKDSRSRLIKYVPVVPICISKKHNPELLPHSLYIFEDDKGFKEYLEVVEESLWGWNVTAWGLTRLIVVCGEYGRNTGNFIRDIKVYYTFMKKWIHFGVHLPPRRHAGVTTLGDLLYIIGGVGEQRKFLATTIVYDLKQRSCRSVANFPEAIVVPAVCTHNNKVYAAGNQNIYRHETRDDKDYWEVVVSTGGKMTHLQSYKKYIYCKKTNSRLYRFDPDVDEELERITSSSIQPALICNLGNDIKVFNQTDQDKVLIDEFKEDSLDSKPRLVSTPMENMRLNSLAGACSLIMTVPPMCADLSQYHRQYLVSE